MQRRAARQDGFSLIELMVAMVITFIVSGAIYGLMASGQGAFRREPALVDRQQNIRIAIDVITRDIQNAGAGMAPFSQIFTDDNPANTMNNPPAGLGSTPSEIFPGERADFLEMLANDGSCPTISVCGAPGGNIFTKEALPACIFGNPATSTFVYVSGENGPAGSADPLHPGLLFANVPGGGGGGGCGNGHINFPAGAANAFNPGGNNACSPTGPPNGNNNTTTAFCRSVARIQFIRYEIAPENPALPVNMLTNPPSLWRSDMGRRNHNATVNAGPYTGADPVGGGVQSPWQLIARGIDDMQVQYFRTGALNNTPGAVVNLNRATIVTQVRVTLSARAIGLNLGALTTYAAAGTPASRGQITITVAPRGALQALATRITGQAANWR